MPVEAADAEPSRRGFNLGGDEFGAARLDHRREGPEVHEVESGLVSGHLLRERRFQASDPVVVEETRKVHDAVVVVVPPLFLGDVPHGVRHALRWAQSAGAIPAAVKLMVVPVGALALRKVPAD